MRCRIFSSTPDLDTVASRSSSCSKPTIVDKFLERYYLPRLNQEDTEKKMNRPVISTEVQTVVKKLSKVSRSINISTNDPILFLYKSNSLLLIYRIFFIHSCVDDCHKE